MADKILELAKAKRDTSQKRLDQLREEMTRLESDVAGWDDFIARANQLANSPQDGHERNGTVKNVTVQRDSIPDKAAALIRAAGRPMTLQEITNALREQGLGEGAANFRGVVNSALWRRQDDLFVKGDDGYDLRIRDYVVID